VNRSAAAIRATIQAPSGRRDLRRALLTIGWIAVLILTLLVLGASTPRQIRQADDPAHSQVSDPERLRGAVARFGMTLKVLVIVQGALGLVTWVLALVIAYLLLRRKSREWFSYVLALNLIAGIGAIYPPDQADAVGNRPVLIVAARLVTLLGIGFLFLMPFYFPDGRLVSRWFAIPVAMIVIGSLPVMLFPNASNPIPIPGVPHADAIWTIAIVGAAILSLAMRYRRSRGLAARQQMKWVGIGLAFGLSLFMAGDWMMRHISGSPGGVAALLGFTFIMPVATALVPITIGVAILNYRLFDIDALISRSLLSAIMTVLVVLAYAGVVLGIGHVLDQQNRFWLSIAGTGLVAVAFQPMRIRVQRGIDRVLFGHRDDPYAVLSRLGVQLEAKLPADDVLPAIVETLTETLRLPYAAIALDSNDGPFVATSAGIQSATLERFPLIYQSERIGELIVGPRDAGQPLGPIDRRLLEDLARQIGVAVRGVQLTADLLRSRERLVTAREEERRRLRRDVHDGLGGQLAALSMQAGSLRNLIRSDPDAAEVQVNELRTELKAAVTEIRRVVQGLRPPALDELGLIGSISERAQRLSVSALSVSMDAPAVLPPLPAATEVAAYRIVEEALTNAAKHSGATNCTIAISCGAALEVTIADNGVGLPLAPAAGVGLGSMRERAEELGGVCTIGANPAGAGTRVHLSLPLTTAGAARHA
jgi:signal transduction histidine kinase